jgi:phosphoesterase RecJ-like protein
MKKIRQEIIDVLLKSRQVLVTAHKGPDGDSLGSQLGLSGFLTAQNISHFVVNDGAIPGKYMFLPGSDTILDAKTFVPPAEPFDTAVVIECSNLDRIGRVKQYIDKDCRIINIDHHQDNILFGNINLKDTKASAAGEMVFDVLKQSGFNMNKDIADNLYTAILTDTGRFHYNSTTPHCLRIAAELLEYGADTVKITEKVYFSMTPAMVRLTGMVLSGMKYLFDGRLCLMTLDKKMFREANSRKGDTEGLVNYSLYADGVELGVLFTELDADRTKVSLRSQDDINVAEIAARYNGGGHFNASGCIVELPLEKAKEVVVECLKESLDGSI